MGDWSGVRIECPTVKSWERARTTPSGRRYHSAEVASAVEEWKWLGIAAMKGQAPTAGPVRVVAEFRLPTRRRVDIDNLAKLPLDALNGIVWLDDSQVVALHVTKLMASPSPGVSLVVEPVSS